MQIKISHFSAIFNHKCHKSNFLKYMKYTCDTTILFEDLFSVSKKCIKIILFDLWPIKMFKFVTHSANAIALTSGCFTPAY